MSITITSPGQIQTLAEKDAKFRLQVAGRSVGAALGGVTTQASSRNANIIKGMGRSRAESRSAPAAGAKFIAISESESSDPWGECSGSHRLRPRCRQVDHLSPGAFLPSLSHPMRGAGQCSWPAHRGGSEFAYGQHLGPWGAITIHHHNGSGGVQMGYE